MKTIAPLLATICVVLVCEIDARKDDEGSCETSCCNNTSSIIFKNCCMEATTSVLPSRFYEFSCAKKLLTLCTSENQSTGYFTAAQQIISRECCRQTNWSATRSMRAESLDVLFDWNKQTFWPVGRNPVRAANELDAERAKFLLQLFSHYFIVKELFTEYSVEYRYPVFTSQDNVHRRFVRSFHAPAAYLVMKKTKDDTLTVVSKSVGRHWRIACICVTWTLISGIIIWLLDRRDNPVEFPKSFWKGVWEGAWWAVVTITTLGYGDKSPKSLLARIYAAAWMINGIIILSIFTAEISSAFTARETIPHHSVLDKSIGVPRGGKYYFQNIFRGAKIIEMNSREELEDHLINGDRSHRSVLHTCKAGRDTDNDMQIVKALEPHIYGIEMRVKPKSSLRKWEGEFEFLLSCVREKVGEHIRCDSMQPDETEEREKECDIDMDDYGQMKHFQRDEVSAIIFYASAGLVAVIFLAGSVWDLTRSPDQGENKKVDLEASISTGHAAMEPIEICVTKERNTKETETQI